MKVINYKIHYLFYKINSYKKNDSKIYNELKFCLTFIFFILFFESNENYEIKLIIQGEGELNILNSQFYLDPSEVIINGVSKPSCKKSCEFVSGLNNVTIKFENQLESCLNMFSGMSNIIEIDLSNLDTSKVVNMESMFFECSNLKKINFGNINTASVTNMKQLFYFCVNLISIDLSNFVTSSVTTMNAMFKGCESLTSLDLTNIDSSKVEDMFDIFCQCKNLLKIVLSKFDTSKVINMRGAFYHNEKIKFLDLSNFKTHSVTNISYIFEGCYELVYINFNQVTIKSFTK